MYYNLMQTVKNLSNHNILVIGDIMLDKYLISDVDRISQEAPVPIADVKKKENYLGGAANVAASIKTLGSNVGILGEIGDDDNGMEVIDLLKHHHINPTVKVTSNVITTTKNRILSRTNQQLIRFDEEMKTTPKEDFINSYIDTILKNFDGVIISDYGKGFINDYIIKTVNEKRTDIPIFIDPSPKTEYLSYINNSYVFPNQNEYNKVPLNKFNNKIITQGSSGIKIQSPLKRRTFEVPPLETHSVWNTTGAGDTVIAIFALGVIAGLDLYECASLANIAAGITIKSAKTYQVENKELQDEIYRLKSKLDLP